LIERSGSECTPIFALVDVEFNSESVSSRRRGLRDSISVSTPPSGASLLQGFTFSSESEDSYGLQLLALLSSDLQLQEGPKLIIPVAVLRSAEPSMDAMDNLLSSESSQVARCLDAGAADVLSQPLQRSRVHGLVIHAYRARRSAQKEITRFMAIKKSRKHSWVGVQSEQPYAYLREAMFAPFSIPSKTEAHD
jgi:3',5'-cyclic-nucleotide phosphodiesterase